ncbi:MAG: family 78 glycoside hydrolase catalytic domain [Bacteroidales bacterium]|nr:family 78 glycoside hydrolase catalytic domain [Bacteroidales bacterium]
MRKYIWFLSSVIFISLSCSRTIDIAEIKCDQKINPTGIGKTPKFSWIMTSEERNQSQTAYQIIVSDEENTLRKNEGNHWNSGKVESDQSLSIPYEGMPLEAGKTYFWKVKIWDKEGGESSWSETGTFITALFDSTDWSGAKWIGYEELADSLYLVPGVSPWFSSAKGKAELRAVVPLFRKEFSIAKNVKSALIFITGLGQYKAFMNGNQISDDFLSPGWTDYSKTCLYNTYDVTDYIRPGENAIGVMVGNGFHNINNERYKKLLMTYGNPKMIAVLKITYTDGTHESILSDASWKTSPSPITYSCIYSGEDYDATLEQPGWDIPSFDASSWKEALLVRPPHGRLEAEITHPVKVNEIFRVDTVMKLAEDTFTFDFGQNAAGIIRVKVKGKKGQTITIRPGELLFENNRINQKSTGSPYYWKYTLKGEEEEFYQPWFTFYGFRYVQIENAVPTGEPNNNGVPEIINIQHLHTYNSTPRVGDFKCSNELFNKVSRLILYAIQSNTQSMMIDCPHREKLGWLEQSYLMGGSVHYNFDIYNIYQKMIKDMGYSQEDNGLIPSTAPEYVYFGYGFTDSPEWGSAGIILPWLIYKWYGDTNVMQEAWPMMTRYIQYLGTRAEDHILSYGLGDWYDLGPNKPGVAQLTPKGVTATATYYYDAILMSRMARLMKKSEEADNFMQLAEEIKAAFNEKYYDADRKVYATGSQTSMAMPLCLGLVPEQDREAVLHNMVDSIQNNDKALTAGDIGFHYLVEALTFGGESQLFYEMNNRDDVPGYGFQIRKGATSLTESWQALPVVSNNHMMLGHIMEWFYKGLCGIQQADSSIAYKYPVIKPSFVGDITSAKASFMSPYGEIVSSWERKSGFTTIKVGIPVNTKAIVYLPTENEKVITEGGKLLNKVNDVKIVGIEDGYTLVGVGSGNYEFKVVDN